MANHNVSRRTLLKGVGTGIAGTAIAGQATAAGEGEYIVGVEPGGDVAAIRNEAASVRRELDFGSVGAAVAGRFPEQAIEALQNNPSVRYVEANGTMQALAQTTPYGIEKVEADLAIDEGETGNGVDVAVIDTGIDAQHEDLEAHLGEGWAADDAACTSDCSGGGPFGGSGNDIDECFAEWDDDNDHGTHCAGTVGAIDDDTGVVGVAPDVTLHAVKVLACDGSGSYDDIAAGIEWAADQGYEVASMSLGGDESSVVKDACVYAREQGMLLVAAAGNDGECTDCVGYPAAYEECIAVSATDENDDLADFSSTGPEVEIAAPGVDVLSTIPRDDYDEFSGTSMACPHVAGGGAQLMANGYSASEARQQLRDTADDIGLDSNEQGYGRMNVAAALELDGDGGDDDGSDNTAPSCSIANPGDGDTVSDTVTVRVDAGDEEDADDSLDVEVSIDGGAYQAASYSSDADSYEYDWDTTAEDDGDVTIDARATDSDGATTDADGIAVTVDNADDGGDGDSAPVVDQFSVSRKSSGPWSRATVDWAVSDDDGDLESVTTELIVGGSVDDSDSSSVSGSSASGEHDVRSRGDPEEVRLVVTDAAGNETTESETY